MQKKYCPSTNSCYFTIWGMVLNHWAPRFPERASVVFTLKLLRVDCTSTNTKTDIILWTHFKYLDCWSSSILMDFFAAATQAK